VGRREGPDAVAAGAQDGIQVGDHRALAVGAADRQDAVRWAPDAQPSEHVADALEAQVDGLGMQRLLPVEPLLQRAES